MINAPIVDCPVVLCLFKLCLCKGTEVGGLLFSHHPGLAMGIIAVLTNSLGFCVFRFFQLTTARPDYVCRVCGHLAGSRRQAYRYDSHPAKQPDWGCYLYPGARNTSDFDHFSSSQTLSPRAMLSTSIMQRTHVRNNTLPHSLLPDSRNQHSIVAMKRTGKEVGVHNVHPRRSESIPCRQNITLGLSA